MTNPAEQKPNVLILREALDECAPRMNGEILHFRPDGTPSPETDRILRSVRVACDRFWASRNRLKKNQKKLLP